MKRLYEISQVSEVENPSPLPFSHASVVSQIFSDEVQMVESLKRSGHYEEKNHKQILERLRLAKNWAEKYAPKDLTITLLKDVKLALEFGLDAEQKKFLKELAQWLDKSDRSPEEIHEKIYETAKGMDLSLKKAFKAIYISLLGTTKGPRASTFIASLDKNWVIERFLSLTLPL